MLHILHDSLINDISGLGKCSLVADISVLTAMGIEACPFPTAVLNAQTGFPAYTCLDLTERMRAYTEGWADLGIRFAGILTGFLMNEKQAEEVLHFTEMFHEPDTLLLVDPVLADHGKPYANYHDALLEKMKELARDADILTPNIRIGYLPQKPYAFRVTVKKNLMLDVSDEKKVYECA